MVNPSQAIRWLPRTGKDMVGTIWRHIEVSGTETTYLSVITDITNSVMDEGKAVTVAKNVSLDTSYAKPELIRTIKVADYSNEE